MRVALEEKARYFAKRIAETEERRAYTLSLAKEYLGDEELKFVKYNKCSCHRVIDICDYYSKFDFGWGQGIYPKKKMITLPLHPFCKCYYTRQYKVRKKPYRVRDVEKEAMDSFTNNQQRQILGKKRREL